MFTRENLTAFCSGLKRGLESYKYAYLGYKQFFASVYQDTTQGKLSVKQAAQALGLILYLIWSVNSVSAQVYDIYQYGYLQSVKNAFFRNRYEVAIGTVIYLGLLAYLCIYEPFRAKQAHKKVTEARKQASRSELEKEFEYVMENARKRRSFDFVYYSVLRDPITLVLRSYTIFTLLEEFAEKLDFNELLIENLCIQYSTRSKCYIVSDKLTGCPKLLERATAHASYLDAKLTAIREITNLPTDITDYIIAAY